VTAQRSFGCKTAAPAARAPAAAPPAAPSSRSPPRLSTARTHPAAHRGYPQHGRIPQPNTV